MTRALRLITLLSVLLLQPAAAGAGLEILVPAYFYPVPGSPWVQLTADAGQVPITAILNPASGPGTTQDPTYVSTVNAFRAAGGRILGYVPTGYATRSAAAVTADVDSYLAFYAIDGIFLDEVTNDAGSTHLDYYAGIYTFIKSRNAGFRVIGNPGTNASEAYLTRPCLDAIVLYENGTGYDNYQTDAWVYRHPRNQIAHLLYAVPTAGDMLSRVDQALSRGVGLIFVTDDALIPNPWDTLPAYWSAEVARIAALSLAATPERPPPRRLRVAPNPTRGRITLTSDVELPAGTRLVLLGVDGRQAWERRLAAALPAGESLVLDFRAGRGRLPADGVYFLAAPGRGDVRATRIVLGD